MTSMLPCISVARPIKPLRSRKGVGRIEAGIFSGMEHVLVLLTSYLTICHLQPRELYASQFFKWIGFATLLTKVDRKVKNR